MTKDHTNKSLLSEVKDLVNNNLRICLVVAPSGSGKSTLIFEMLKSYKNIIDLSVSYTTRQRRKDEVNGLHYNFCTKEYFKDQIKLNNMLEWAKVHDDFYGTSILEVQKILKKNRNVLLEIDIQGLIQIKKVLPCCDSLFILPPSFEEMQKRLKTRNTESSFKLKTRFKSALKELELSGNCDDFLINDDLTECQKTFNNWIKTRYVSQLRSEDYLKKVKATIDQMIDNLTIYANNKVC